MAYAYSYDAAHNITTKATEHGTYQYTYDALDRVTRADTPQGLEAFTYDKVGNRLTDNQIPGTWAYNANNELLSNPNTTFRYDANGSTIEKDQNGSKTHYTYNLEHRLSNIQDTTGTPLGEYYYDPFGRRLWKAVSGSKTYYHYADEGLVGEFNSSGAAIRTYGYRPGAAWGTDPLFLKEGTNYHYYHNDHLGTPQRLTNASGAVTWFGKYKAFGAVTKEIETVNNTLRFPGQVEDGESGGYYNYFRSYSPTLGRYVILDPMGLMSGNNLYKYANASPMNFTDPLGLFLCDDWKWMALDWFLGTGSRNRWYDGFSDQVQDIRNLPPIKEAKGFYRNKNKDKLSDDCCQPSDLAPVTNYAAKFGFKEFILATVNGSCAWHFLGRFGIEIYPGYSCREVKITVTNNSSLKSFFYGLPPDGAGGTSGMVSHFYQTYEWREPL